jgi:hypothetical protein
MEKVVLVICMSGSNRGHLRLKTRSHRPYILTSCKHIRGLLFQPNFPGNGKRGFYNNFKVKFEYGSLGVKT